MLRTDGHRLAPLAQDSDATQVLRALSRTRKQLVESRVGLVNQLQAELERCFPGAIGLFARLDSDVAIRFRRRYPTQHAATRLAQVEAEGHAVCVLALLRRHGQPGAVDSPHPPLMSTAFSASKDASPSQWRKGSLGDQPSTYEFPHD